MLKSKIKVPDDSVSGEISLSGLQTAAFLLSFMVGRERDREREGGGESIACELPGVSFQKDADPIRSVLYPEDPLYLHHKLNFIGFNV